MGLNLGTVCVCGASLLLCLRALLRHVWRSVVWRKYFDLLNVKNQKLEKIFLFFT
jgi:hypothetical protein